MKLLYSLLLAVGLLTGCVSNRPIVSPSKPAVARPAVTGEIISYSTILRELRPLMTEEYDPKLIVMDSVYGSVSEEDTRRIIAEGFSKFHFNRVEEASDCDDSSIELTVLLRSFFRRDTHNVPLAAPVGIVGGALVGNIPELKFVSPGFPLYHAMVVFRCRGGKWLLVEPESKQVTEFTGTIYEGSFDFFLGIF